MSSRGAKRRGDLAFHARKTRLLRGETARNDSSIGFFNTLLDSLLYPEENGNEETVAKGNRTST